MEDSFPLSQRQILRNSLFLGVAAPPQHLQSPGWDRLRYPRRSITQNTPESGSAFHMEDEERGQCSQPKPAAGSQDPHQPQSPRAGRALRGHQVQLGNVQSLSRGSRCKSRDFPLGRRVLLQMGQNVVQIFRVSRWIRGEDLLAQVTGRSGLAAGARPERSLLQRPARSPGRLRGKEGFGTERPPGAAWGGPPKPDPTFLCPNRAGLELGGARAAPRSILHKFHGTIPRPRGSRASPALPTRQTRRKIGFEQQTGARLSLVPVPLSFGC